MLGSGSLKAFYKSNYAIEYVCVAEYNKDTNDN